MTRKPGGSTGTHPGAPFPRTQAESTTSVRITLLSRACPPSRVDGPRCNRKVQLPATSGPLGNELVCIVPLRWQRVLQTPVLCQDIDGLFPIIPGHPAERFPLRVFGLVKRKMRLQSLSPDLGILDGEGESLLQSSDGLVRVVYGEPEASAEPTEQTAKGVGFLGEDRWVYVDARSKDVDPKIRVPEKSTLAPLERRNGTLSGK